MEINIKQDLEWMYKSSGKCFDYYNIRKFDNGTSVVNRGIATVVFETETTFFVVADDGYSIPERVTKSGKYNILDTYALNKARLLRRISAEDFIEIVLFTNLSKESASILIESVISEAISERDSKKDWRSELDINDVKDWFKDV